MANDLIDDMLQNWAVGQLPTMQQRRPSYSGFEGVRESPRVDVDPSALRSFLDTLLLGNLWNDPHIDARNDFTRSMDEYFRRNARMPSAED